MVLWYKASHPYHADFATVSKAYLNRYPNPFASHVLSIDLISFEITPAGKLLQTKLICKKGRLPSFLSPFLGKINQTWIIEKTLIDPVKKEMMTYTRNLDHTKIIRIEEYSKFKYDINNEMFSETAVKFSSGYVSLRDRIENWSHKKFGENLSKSRKGLNFVINNFNAATTTQQPDALAI